MSEEANWRYRGEDQVADELREIAKDTPCSMRKMHLEMAAQIVEQGQFMHPNDFGMQIENEALTAKLAEAEARIAKLIAAGDAMCRVAVHQELCDDCDAARQAWTEAKG